jgi:nucleoside transporter
MSDNSPANAVPAGGGASPASPVSPASAPSSSVKTLVALAAMMFLQYMLFAVWFVQLSAYLPKAHVDGVLASFVLGMLGIGSMASPVICALADRYLAAQKVLALSNILTAVLLFVATQVHSPVAIAASLALAFLFYMPTWALTGVIAMSHAGSENFPRIRTFGSAGWVASGLFSVVAVKCFGLDAKEFDGTALPLYCGAATALIAAVLNIATLPNTPPKGGDGKFSIGRILGLKAFSLLKDKNYFVFIVGSFVATIAFVLYFLYAALFVEAKGFTYITKTINWGQAAEMVFMFLTTTILAKIGVKKALLVGLSFMTLRYLSFYVGDVNNIEALYIVGILFHGLIFGLFYAGGQVYTDKKAPNEIRAQAQGMFAFLIWGVAITLGSFIYGALIERATTLATAPDALLGTKIVATTQWSPIFLGTAVLSAVVVAFFLLFFKDEEKPVTAAR